MTKCTTIVQVSKITPNVFGMVAAFDFANFQRVRNTKRYTFKA